MQTGYSIKELLTDEEHPQGVYSKDNKAVSIELALEEVIFVGVYFGSHMTQGFTTALEEVYYEASC